MKVLGHLIAACIALAGLRLVVVILVLGICVTTVIAMITRPRETVGFVLVMMAVGAVDRHPVAFAALTGVVVAVSLLAKTVEQSER